MARKRLGEVLLARGAITKAQLEDALAYARRTRQRLGGALVQKGHLSEEALVHALSESLGLAAVDLERTFVDWNAVQLLSSGVCEAYGLFPYAIEAMQGRRQLLVAMVDPLNLSAVEEVEFTTGFPVSARLAPLAAVHAAILRHYHQVNVPEEVPETEEEEDFIEGEEMAPPPAPPRIAPVAALSNEGKVARSDYPADFLDDGLADELWRRRFWALIRLLVKKRIVTQDEVNHALRELD
jgi:Type II secretion system (T2SS), protein E, N-terminal domain